MSERIYYISEVTGGTTIVLSPFDGTTNFETRPGIPSLGQITIVGTEARYAPCELWQPIQSCVRYRVIIQPCGAGPAD